MPVATEMTVKASEIKRGDRVFDKFTGLDSSLDCEAYDVKHGNKFVTVKNGNAQVISRREFSEVITVERMVPTEEEIAAEKAQDDINRREYFSTSVAKWVNTTIHGWQNFVNEQAVNAIKYPGQCYGSSIENLMTQGAKVRIAQQITNVYENGSGQAMSSWADAFDIWANRARQTLIDGVSMSSDALSRSTSVISNLTEDVWIAEIRSILDYAKFGYLR